MINRNTIALPLLLLVAVTGSLIMFGQEARADSSTYWPHKYSDYDGDWTSEAKGFSDDGNFAYTDSWTDAGVLKYYDFNVNIPSGALVTSVRASVEWLVHKEYDPENIRDALRLTLKTKTKIKTATVYSAAWDTWKEDATTLTSGSAGYIPKADLADNYLRIELDHLVQGSPLTPDKIQIDYVKITVYYTDTNLTVSIESDYCFWKVGSTMNVFVSGENYDSLHLYVDSYPVASAENDFTHLQSPPEGGIFESGLTLTAVASKGDVSDSETIELVPGYWHSSYEDTQSELNGWKILSQVETTDAARHPFHPEIRAKALEVIQGATSMNGAIERIKDYIWSITHEGSSTEVWTDTEALDQIEREETIDCKGIGPLTSGLARALGIPSRMLTVAVHYPDTTPVIPIQWRYHVFAELWDGSAWKMISVTSDVSKVCWTSSILEIQANLLWCPEGTVLPETYYLYTLPRVDEWNGDDAELGWVEHGISGWHYPPSSAVAYHSNPWDLTINGIYNT